MAEERMDCDSGSPEPETNQSDKYRQRGNEAYKSGDYQQARDLYSSAIQLDPQNATLYGNRSASYMMLQDFSAALEDSTRSVHLDESYTKGYLRAAKCHLMLGNPNLSIDFYRKVLSVQPRHKQAKEELEVSQRALLHLERANLETERGEHRTVSQISRVPSPL